MFSAVYGPVLDIEKEAFRLELSGTADFWGLLWMIGGDFNAIRCKEERSSGRILKMDRVLFNKLLEDFEMLEFSREGPNFTINNKQAAPCLSRLVDLLRVVNGWNSLESGWKSRWATLALIIGLSLSMVDMGVMGQSHFVLRSAG